MSAHKKLSLNEIFYSIQGEGFWTGLPTIFVRFAGCNLSCDWCDTKYADNVTERLTSMQLGWRLMKHLETIPQSITLTGGEPTMQPEDEMNRLTAFLLGRGVKHLAVETNGVLYPGWLGNCTWVTVSPKRGSRANFNFAKEIKLVYDNHTEAELVEFEALARLKNLRLYLQPRSNLPAEIEKVVEIAKERKLWRVSLQLHKILNVR